MPQWADTVLSAIVSIILALIAAGVLTNRANKRKLTAEANNTDVSAAAQLSEAALSILKQARIDAEFAGAQARESRVEAERTRDEMRQLTKELDTVRDYLTFIVDWIKEQGLTPPSRQEMERRRPKF